MKRNDKKILQLFQCDFNRNIEETFAQVLTENELIRLFFINENQAFTDGRNIVVDPAIGEVFANKEALIRAEDFMQIGRNISCSPWHALRMITRGQNIHECLHIIYSDFPNGIKTDPRAISKIRIKTLSLISNIIEDAFIEAVGCSIYDNLELYLAFERVAVLFSNTIFDGTIERALKNETTEAREPLPLIEYLSYMATFLLYPMVMQSSPSDNIIDYVNKTKQLFLDGSACGEPKARYNYIQQIFDAIEQIIPESTNELDDELITKILPGYKTHSDCDNTIGTFVNTGNNVNITRRLFTDLKNNDLPKRDFGKQINALISEYINEKNAAIKIVSAKPIVIEWNGAQFDCAAVHKNIKLIETKPKPNLNLRRAYQNIYNKYHININSFNSRFTQLLKARVPIREEKHLFGSGIATNRLSDVKKRYWFRKAEDYGIPDIAIMLLIDGSGSMSGERKENAMVSSVILHEVLKKQNISHAIIEHRAVYNEPIVRHNILIDFKANDEDKLNILTLKADDGTREGLSLYWAEKYISEKTTNEARLIIVLSDGVPAHGIDGDGCYLPPVSVKDTANAALKIIKRGTDIIAVALDVDTHTESSCYDLLKEIYPSVIACTNLKQLTGQLLNIISKTFR